jgi:DNA-directed RNA polymerase subunit RPC12/RpoP
MEKSEVKCPFCGHVFTEDDARGGCKGCPMGGACARTKCPNCGYEVLKEPRLLKALRRLGVQRNARA